jgi:hypothetical protein
MRIASSCIVACAIAIAMPLPASAQTAEAETLFREGKRLMKIKKIAEACEKFEASERLEPLVGTELNLGLCREKNGQTASAWAMFAKAAANAKRAGIEDSETEARKRAARLEKKLIYLTIEVPADSALDDLVVRRNQTSLDRALWNQAVPVDPDDYTITAEAPDHTPWSVTIAVKTKSRTIEVPKLERDEHAPEHKAEHATPATGTPDTTAATAATPARTDRDDAKRPSPPPVETPRRYRSAAIALGVIGASAIVIGTGFAVYSSHLESESDATCPMVACTDAHAFELNQSARTDGWIANISWGVGVVALAGAATAWWLGRPTQRDSISLVPTGGRDRAGFALEGRF